MRFRWTVMALALGLALPMGSSGESLGSAAKKEKERRQKNKDAGVSAREISQDDLAATKGELAGPVDSAASGGDAAAPATGSARASGSRSSDDGGSGGGSSGSAGGDEASWRRRADAARARIRQAQSKYDEAMSKKAPLKQGKVPGGRDAQGHYMSENAWVIDIEENQRIAREQAEAKEALDQAKQDLENLSEDARHAGVPAGWIR
jgi:hypothetical protein